MKAALTSALAYAAITAIMGRQVLASLGTAIGSDAGDPVLTAAILAWNAQQVPWTDAWFQFPIFHPIEDALAFSEHLLGLSIVASPIYWITGNALTTYNLTLLLTYALSGLAMYALVWGLTRHTAAAFLAGLAFAFAPYRASHLPHIQVLAVFWAPLALLGLHAFVGPAGPPSAGTALHGGNSVWAGSRGVAPDTPRPRRHWLALYAFAWMLQGASNAYFLVYFSVLVGLWVLWFVVARQRWRDLALISGATVVASVPLLPILYRYLAVHGELGLSRNLGEIASFGADIGGVLCAPEGLTFWGWLHIACAPEGELFVGLALVVLCLVAAMTGHRATETRSETNASWFRDSVARRIRVVRRLAIAVAIAFLAIAVSTLVLGPWRFEFGVVRASASGVGKPLSTALALLLAAYLLSPSFHRLVHRGSTTTFYLAAAIVCWVLAWGPAPRFFGIDALYQAPFAWLLRFPGVGGLRVPARFWMMAVICLCVFLGLVMAQLLTNRPRRTSMLFTAAAAVALLADGWTAIPVAAVAADVPDPRALRGRTVLSFPIGGPDGDVIAGYRAVLGGWRSINGYSGYEPGYYEALRALSRAGDPALFGPFVERGDVHVIVADDAVSLRGMVEAQPEVELEVSGHRMRQYRLPRRSAATGEVVPLGERILPQQLSASCSTPELMLAVDGDVATSWVCGAQLQDHSLTVDAGRPTTAGVLVMSLGVHGYGFPRELIVETSLDGTQWDRAWHGSPAARVLRAALDSPRQTRVTLHFAPREARYLRLRQVGRGERFWSIAELEVWTGAP